VIGALVVAAIAVASTSALVFQVRDEGASAERATSTGAGRRAVASTTTSTGAGSGVIDAMNGDRAGAGLAPLCANAALNGFAQSWANWMAANQSLTHQDLGAVLGGTSFDTVAENILSGPGDLSVAQMEGAWMGSPGHRVHRGGRGHRAQQRWPGLGRSRVRRLTLPSAALPIGFVATR
jgi:uncharacterized protein YkwD